MISAGKTTRVSALHEILKWSSTSDCPGWQKDALRRIIVQESLDRADIEELDRLCRMAHGFDKGASPPLTVKPLSSSHLPPGPAAGSSVTLVSLGKLERVNRLASDEVLTFGNSPGLTIIFGDNGSGKSGYARVVKRACRSRGAPPAIRPNIYEKPVGKPAAAEITCRIGGVETPINWEDNGESDPRLANVFVFDGITARHYLEEDDRAAFTPYGLDILPKLTKLCDVIDERIAADIKTLNLELSTVKTNWNYVTTTAVGKLISKLSANTKREDIDKLAGLDDKDAKRLKALNETLKSNPKQKAKETRASADRLRKFSGLLKATAKHLANDNVVTIKKLAGEAKATAAAAKAFATGQFDHTYLKGTGEDLWRELWDAAKSYSDTDAYPERHFPVTDDGAKCVLCQQDLHNMVPERFKKFDEFVTNASQIAANKAAAALADAVAEIKTLQPLSGDLKNIDADLSMTDEDQRAALTDFVKEAANILATLKSNLTNGSWVDPSRLPASPADTIDAWVKSLEDRATLEESADDPAKRAEFVTEQNELAAREWLSGVKDDVFAQIERYKSIELLRKCQNDTNTRKITNKNKVLTKKLVTEEFCKCFENETKELGLRTLSVKLEEIKGRKAETKFGLRLSDSSGHKVTDIASEGEQRCVSLAAFLAELSQASHTPSLVFDDPASSLDHGHRERIAARLVKEAGVRQVIVFTHDPVFLHGLQTSAMMTKCTTQIWHLEWNGSVPGRCVRGLPWDLKSAADRLDKLDKEQSSIAKSWNPIPNEKNIQAMRRAYTWLRATLERIVEKEVFADVVFRFRSYVKVGNLDKVVGFSTSECKEIKRLMKKCHDVTDSHDPASGKHAAVPDPVELAKDITDTKAVRASIRTRH